MIRVAVVGAQRLVRGMLDFYVGSQPGMQVVGEAHDYDEAVGLCEDKSPDVTLVDISLPSAGGIAVTRKIVALLPDAAVLVLVEHAHDDLGPQAIQAGAHGYLHKDSRLEELVGAIRSAHAGEPVVPTGTASGSRSPLRRDGAPRGCNLSALTEREMEILRAMARGESTRQIAETLRISERTVRNHAYNIYKKMRVDGRNQAVLFAVRRGLVDLGSLD